MGKSSLLVLLSLCNGSRMLCLFVKHRTVLQVWVLGSELPVAAETLTQTHKHNLPPCIIQCLSLAPNHRFWLKTHVQLSKMRYLAYILKTCSHGGSHWGAKHCFEWLVPIPNLQLLDTFSNCQIHLGLFVLVQTTQSNVFTPQWLPLPWYHTYVCTAVIFHFALLTHHAPRPTHVL